MQAGVLTRGDVSPDIYFDPAYGCLYQQAEGGRCELFEYRSDDGAVRNVYIRRPVPWLLDGRQLYDIVTPYGYGGPLIERCVPGREHALRDGYARAFAAHCARERIVAEFIRFHPLLDNARDWTGYCPVAFDRHTVAVDLTDAAYASTQMRPECRNKLRKTVRRGVTAELDTTLETIGGFAALYRRTMAKNDAAPFYFFSDAYFRQLADSLHGAALIVNAIADGSTIASAIFLRSARFLHYHLSATDPDRYGYAANNLILAAAIEYGCAQGLQWLHLGGGRSADPHDALFRFKRSFARAERNLMRFYVGRKVHDAAAYARLVDCARAMPGWVDSGFFPAYRGMQNAAPAPVAWEFV